MYIIIIVISLVTLSNNRNNTSYHTTLIFGGRGLDNLAHALGAGVYMANIGTLCAFVLDVLKGGILGITGVIGHNGWVVLSQQYKTL